MDHGQKPSLTEQLDQLRRRVKEIDEKYAGGQVAEGGVPRVGRTVPGQPFRPGSLIPNPLFEPETPDPERPERYFVHEYLDGNEVETPAGKHFETERLFERHRLHGSMDIASLESMAEDLLADISGHEIPPSPPTSWAFLDTETTGLAGGSGTYAFLVGVGRITPEGFRVRQFFMRDYGEEPSLVYALTEHLAGFDVLVTYNGKTYDVPLLETRYRMNRTRPPFGRMGHLDLLYGARRLWKLRFESCRLMELERQILGVEREGDIPGEMIPYVYFEYLRNQEASRIVPVFHHNAIDILTLACLTGIVPCAFRSPEDTPLRHGTELLGVARWLRQSDRLEQAAELMRRAVDADLADDLLFRTLWDLGLLEKKLGREPAAVTLFTDLSTCRNPHQVKALGELAKHYEHRERDFGMALECTLNALEIEDTPELRHRELRLKKKLARPRNRKLL